LNRTIRVLALIEAQSVSGPAKNLIEFAASASQPREGLPCIALSIVTFQRGVGQPNAFVIAAKKAGLEIFVIEERRRFDTRAMAQLRAIVQAFRPDVIQSHNVKSHFFVRKLGLHLQAPWIAFNHGYTSKDFKDRLYNQLDRWSLRVCFRLVTMCKPFAKMFERLGVAPERIRIQHNSVRPFARPADEVVARIRQELGIAGERIVLTVGRMSREKGHADLLRAIARLVERGTFHNCRVVFVGDGPEMESLKALSAKLGLGELICFAGHQVEVGPYYALATLLALPSHSEGSPNVVLEAMAAGVPVVATAAGGVPEILTDQQNGLIVPLRDPAAMADGIERLLQDELLRSGVIEASRQCAATLYTPEARCSSLIALYEETLSAWRNLSGPGR
jgi:glycosyltransferase involved in cell wall biosynthesis